MWRYFHQIQVGLTGYIVRLFDRDDPNLFTFLTNYAYFRSNNLLIDPMLRFLCGDISILQNSTAAARGFGFQALGKPIYRHTAQFPTTSRAHGHGTSFHFPITDNQ